MDDYLDDPELWKAIESAALSSRHRKTLPPPSPAPLFPPHCLSPSPSHQFAYRNPCRPRPKPQPDEVWQPEKKPRVSVQESMDRRIVVAQNQIATNVMPRQVKPDPNPIAFQSPVKSRVVVSEVSPVVESPSPVMEGKLGSRHSLLIGEFPSVASFKHYQDMALEGFVNFLTASHGTSLLFLDGARLTVTASFLPLSVMSRCPLLTRIYSRIHGSCPCKVSSDLNLPR
ncbi:Peptide transporter family 1 [Rhynchospora pubera]|uniref:Peptide transporter family 1 n=1 Tax=Rhynchospora pubera TaxID=906938 RepID=A0AAV8D6F9_9POAL|nr:Peptide transporter family 1 [Rhynchospora pubera]